MPVLEPFHINDGKKLDEIKYDFKNRMSDVDFEHYETVEEMISGATKKLNNPRWALSHFCCGNKGVGFTNSSLEQNQRIFVSYKDEKEILVNFLEKHGYQIEDNVYPNAFYATK